MRPIREGGPCFLWRGANQEERPRGLHPECAGAQIARCPAAARETSVWVWTERVERVDPASKRRIIDIRECGGPRPAGCAVLKIAEQERVIRARYGRQEFRRQFLQGRRPAMIFRLKLSAGFYHLTGTSHCGSVIPDVEAYGGNRRQAINCGMPGQLTGAWQVFPSPRPDQQG